MKTNSDPKSVTHTPAPWRIGNNCSTIFGPKSNEPAPVTNASLPLSTARVSAEERQANARLLAAAPELLEALKGLLANAPVPVGKIKKEFSYLLFREAAQRAIQKATQK